MPHCWKSRATAQLTNPPVLAYADYHLPFKLHTDASSTGLGAVLCQQQDGQDKVVSYASRRLKPPEKNYPSHKLEYLALKWSVTETFHDYLFTISTLIAGSLYTGGQ